MSSQLKYFVKCNELSDGNSPHELFAAQIVTIYDVLSNVPLLNALFEFPESGKEMNERYFNKLSVPQHCDDDDCHGMCRDDFITYYVEHPTLFEELLKEYDDSSSSEVYFFETLEAMTKWLIESRCVHNGAPMQDVKIF